MTPNSTIYEPAPSQTSNNRGRHSRWVRACAGLALGGSVWMWLALLGIPNVFHMTRMTGLIPLAIAGALVATTRFSRVLVLAAAVTFVALITVAYTPLFIAPARSFIRADPLPPSADAVVVLSAGVTPDGFLHQQGLDRLLKGLALVRRGVAPTLLLTREERDVNDKKVTAAADQDSLAALAGVANIISTPLEASTHDEALAVKKIAVKAGWKRIVLVTSPFHTRRACATFEHVGLTVSCTPSDSRDIAVKSLDFPDDRIEAFSMLIYELAATLQYRRLGWL